uniref:Uncharacterized protein n=1 Tax=Anguilla anguilla TaxID=7936 RepID=A0A0E9RVA9_ANGAN
MQQIEQLTKWNPTCSARRSISRTSLAANFGHTAGLPDYSVSNTTLLRAAEVR